MYSPGARAPTRLGIDNGGLAPPALSSLNREH